VLIIHRDGLPEHPGDWVSSEINAAIPGCRRLYQDDYFDTTQIEMTGPIFRPVL